MSSRLVPKDPEKVMVIREVVPRTITTLSVPFARFGMVKVGGRGTIVRLHSGALAVFSPVALTDDVKQKVSELGEVKYITALDIEHHIFLGPWHQAYPDAKVLGPEGLPEKRRSQNKESVKFTHIFSKNNPLTTVDTEFDSEFDYEFVHAHQNKEVAFLHKPTKTLIQADLMFNYPSTEQYSRTGEAATSGIFTKIFGAVTNTQGNWQRRMIWYGISRQDRQGFARSVAKIDKWNFERIIPCHGDVIETGGKGIFRKIMQWHLDLERKSS